MTSTAPPTAAVDHNDPAPGDSRSSRSRPRHRGAYLEMLLSAAVGLTAALVLSIEAIHLAADPAASFSCDLSATISCTKVALSWQAQLLGFPNAYLGLIFEPIVITVAAAGLGGTRFPRWFLLTVQALYTVAVGFAYWLFWQSATVIGAACLWCTTVTITTLAVFVSMARVNILDRNITLPPRVRARVEYALRVGADQWLVAVAAAVVLGVVIVRYT